MRKTPAEKTMMQRKIGLTADYRNYSFLQQEATEKELLLLLQSLPIEGLERLFLSPSAGKTCSEDVKTRPSSGFSKSSTSSRRGDNSALRYRAANDFFFVVNFHSVLEEEGAISLSSSPPLITRLRAVFALSHLL